MKTLAALSFGSMLLAVGCVDRGEASEASDEGASDGATDGADEASTASELEAASTFEDVVARHGDNHNRLANNVPVRDASGVFTTVSVRGYVDLNNEFFQDLGT